MPTRRAFLEQSVSAGVTAGALASAAAFGAEAKSANDRLTVAVIGPGGMGSNHLALLTARKDVRVAYVCDVDATRLAAAAKKVEQSDHGAPKAVGDLRNVLEDQSVDAVWIATPDHWHAPAAIMALDAAKHVYVEKPCAHNVREGRLLVEAARRNGRVCQVGTQARSTPHVAAAVKLLREGIIGDVLVAKAWNSQLRGNIGKQKPADPPTSLDFDLWLGPAPKRAYQSNLLHAVWRFWYDFGVGDIGNDGVHEIDVARWGLGVTTQPSSVTAMGSKYFHDDDQEFPDNQYCTFEWPGDGQPGSKRMLVYEQRDWSPYVQEGYENGNAFYGTKGMMILAKGFGFQVFGPRNKPISEGKGGADLPAHHQNFLDCVRTGSRPNADVEEGHLSASLAHFGNIACRTGGAFQFDTAKERIVGNEAADKLLTRTYREGHWAVPKGV
jgi:predicted dehydrogenase